MVTQAKKDGASLSITKTYDLGKPTEAVQMAVLLKNLVIQQKLYVPIKGKNYAMVEAWQLAGFLSGISVLVDDPKDLSNDKEVKYSSKATLFKDGVVVGVGHAVCSSKESSKKAFDEYAILSMAQTRAIGKAYRNKIGFIMKLAGFQPTPSEEMHKVDEVPSAPSNDSPDLPIINVDEPRSEMDKAITRIKATKSIDGLNKVWITLPAKIREDDEVLAFKNEFKKSL